MCGDNTLVITSQHYKLSLNTIITVNCFDQIMFSSPFSSPHVCNSNPRSALHRVGVGPQSPIHWARVGPQSSLDLAGIGPQSLIHGAAVGSSNFSSATDMKLRGERTLLARQQATTLCTTASVTITEYPESGGISVLFSPSQFSRRFTLFAIKRS